MRDLKAKKEIPAHQVLLVQQAHRVEMVFQLEVAVVDQLDRPVQQDHEVKKVKKVTLVQIVKAIGALA
jgi:hypothetical protein